MAQDDAPVAIPHRLRNGLQLTKALLLAAFAIIVVAATAAGGANAALLPPSLVAIVAGLLAYAMYLVPCLELDDSGLTIVNWATRTRIPWQAYTGVETRFGLVVTSADPASDRGDAPAHRDTVACFPGSGGLAHGRARLGARGRREPEVPRGSRPSGRGTEWVSSRRAAELIERAAGRNGGPSVGRAQPQENDRRTSRARHTPARTAPGPQAPDLDLPGPQAPDLDLLGPDAAEREGAYGRTRRLLPASAAALAAGILCLATGAWLSLP